MGDVYQARDTRLRRVVAIKVLKQGFSERFQREARAIASLNHPHICTLYDIGSDYLVMEYIEGKPLRGPLPRAKALAYAAQILEALEAAHSHGIIHRDLKPANVLLTANGIKLLDFGLARMQTAEGDGDNTLSLSRTAEHTVVGTPQYMAPEQIEGRSVDERVDIFAFGCVLYELLTGKRTFEGRTSSEVMSAIRSCDERTYDELLKVAHPAVHRVISVCLRSSPEARWRTAQDVRFALGAIADAGAPAATRSRSGLLAWIASSLLLIGLLICSYFLWQRHPESGERQVFSLAPPEGTADIEAAVISPDGKFVAMLAGARLWIRALGSASARPVDGSADARTPFWAPDSSAVGFFAEGKLKRVAAQGGPPITIAAAPDSQGGTWSSDQYIIFSPYSRGRLYRVPASGGEVTRVTELSAGQIGHNSPLLLPNGQLLYTAYGSPGAAGFYVAEIARSGAAISPRLLVSNSRAIGYAQTSEKDECVLFFEEEALFAQRFHLSSARFAGSRHQVVVPGQGPQGGQVRAVSLSMNNVAVMNSKGPELSSVLSLDRAGQVKRIISPVALYNNLGLSPDDKSMMVTRRIDSLDLWLHDLTRGTVLRFTSDPAADGVPVWSPDGSTVVFTSWRGGGSNLYIKPANGARPERLLLGSDAEKYPSDWSSDGHYIMYASTTLETASDLWILPMSPDGRAGQPKVYLNSEFIERDGRFSPDVRWVAYTSDETGRDEVYVQSFPVGKGKWQISTGGGGKPVWKRDGRELYYVSSDGYMMAAPVSIGEKFESSNPRRLFVFTLGSQSFGPQFAVDRKAETFFVLSRASARPQNDLHVVLNWRPDLN
jgi:Tol biopolymer transport system component